MIKNVIEQGNFELSDILKKIDTFYIKGDIIEEQRTELIELAQSKANPQNSMDIMQKIEELDKRVKVLESILEDSHIDDVEPSEYVVGKWYYAGDTVTFEGKKYNCIAPEGVVCVWSPKDYPAYWEMAE